VFKWGEAADPHHGTLLPRSKERLIANCGERFGYSFGALRHNGLLFHNLTNFDNDSNP
jgi:hypothetical protein